MLFCRDGVLRKEEWVYNRKTRSGRHVYLPYRTLCELDPHAFAKDLTRGIEFEDGLTVRELFLNLEPWADVLEGLCCMDFRAFLAEAQKPRTGTDDPKTALSHIEIYAHTRLAAVPAFEETGRDLVKTMPVAGGHLRQWIPPTPKITDKIDFEHFWDYSAHYAEPQDDGHGCTHQTCSVDYTPVSEWAHLPIRIAPKMSLIDEMIDRADYCSSPEPLLNPNHPMVTTEWSYDNSRVLRYALEVDAPYPTFMTTLVRGFFWEIGFEYSPAGRDALVDTLKERMGEVYAALDAHRGTNGDADQGEIVPATAEMQDRIADLVEGVEFDIDEPLPDDEDDDHDNDTSTRWLMKRIAFCESRSPELVRWK